MVAISLSVRFCKGSLIPRAFKSLEGFCTMPQARSQVFRWIDYILIEKWPFLVSKFLDLVSRHFPPECFGNQSGGKFPLGEKKSWGKRPSGENFPPRGKLTGMHRNFPMQLQEIAMSQCFGPHILSIPNIYSPKDLLHKIFVLPTTFVPTTLVCGSPFLHPWVQYSTLWKITLWPPPGHRRYCYCCSYLFPQR